MNCLLAHNLSLKSLKRLLIKNFFQLTSERKKKENLECRLQKLNEEISHMKLKFTQQVTEKVGNDGNLLYSNETKRTVAKREMETSSKYFQRLLSKKVVLQKEFSKSTINYSNLISLRIALNNLVLLATVEPNLFKCKKRKRKTTRLNKDLKKSSIEAKNLCVGSQEQSDSPFA